tara:strand:- start:2400 stop:3035 length:636 start_codon:yes stop_codon:yes gene_type:complete
MDINLLKPVKRDIDSDNSCLFNAIGYLCNKSDFGLNTAKNMRKMIADYVNNNKDKYNDAILEMSNNDYQKFITNPEKWGGQIEIDIFSKIFEVEICVFDIMTLRMDEYGSENNYENCIYLLYDGIHYDSLVMNMDDGSNPDLDITIFSREYKQVLYEKFFEIVKNLNSNNSYVDAYNLVVICKQCNDIISGQKSIQDHSKNTGHINFEQIE